MFLVSCYYTVSSFSRSTDVSSKNLHCTGLIDVASLLAAWNRQAQSFPLSCCPSLIRWLFCLLVHISFLVSTHFLTRFSLLLPFEYPYFVHLSIFSSLILTILSAITSCSEKSFVSYGARVRVSTRTRTKSVNFSLSVSQGGIWWYGNLFSTAPNSSAVIVVCGSSGKDRESEVEEDRRDRKERERRMWKIASQMA